MNNGIVIIKKGREKPILQQHPWIFSGAIDSVEGDPTPGDIVTVTARDGRFLARGYWNPKSQIQVRILTWDDEDINEDWWRRMLKRAILVNERSKYHALMADGSVWNPAHRVINAENDFLPGLIVDRYGDWLVLQALTLGIDIRKTNISNILSELFSESGVSLTGIYERSDVDVRTKEGLDSAKGVLWGDEPPRYVVINERTWNFNVDLINGHKTGFYLDQRDNRSLLYETVAQFPVRLQDIGKFPSGKEKTLLNLFSYTGAFGLCAFRAGATHIVNVDASHEALELAEENIKLNVTQENLQAKALNQFEFIQADVFELLRDYAAENKQFDVVILDPPKFAHNAGQVEKASRGYKDINLNAFKCVKPGGYLMTFSCSGAISADLFQKIVFGALADSGRQAQILKHLGPGDDHPVALTFPEGAYLKGLLLRVY